MSVVIYGVSIVVKIKCVNFSNISDICDKLNFMTNYTHFIITDTFYQNTYKYYTFYTFGGMIPLRDLYISTKKDTRILYSFSCVIGFFPLGFALTRF